MHIRGALGIDGVETRDASRGVRRREAPRALDALQCLCAQARRAREAPSAKNTLSTSPTVTRDVSADPVNGISVLRNSFIAASALERDILHSMRSKWPRARSTSDAGLAPPCSRNGPSGWWSVSRASCVATDVSISIRCPRHSPVTQPDVIESGVARRPNSLSTRALARPFARLSPNVPPDTHEHGRTVIGSPRWVRHLLFDRKPLPDVLRFRARVDVALRARRS